MKAELKEKLVEKDVEIKDVLFDSQATQRIKLVIEQNGETFELFHNMKPISDERFYELELEAEAVNKRAKTLKSSLVQPKFKLWQELVESIEGYEEDSQWRENMYPLDAVSVISQLLDVQAVLPESKGKAKGVLFSRNRPIEIITKRLFNGVLCVNSHFFRVETELERDEYLAIMSGEPSVLGLASAEKKCTAERLAVLYDRLCQDAEGYANLVPAPDKAAASMKFFQTQFERLGK